MDRSSAEGALVEVPKVPREVGWKEGARPLPLPENFLLLDLKLKHFGAVFKLDLTEETRTQLQEEEAVASSCLILATSMTET